MVEFARFSPDEVPRRRHVAVSDESCQPSPDRLEIFSAQRVSSVGDAPVIGTHCRIDDRDQEAEPEAATLIAIARSVPSPTG